MHVIIDHPSPISPRSCTRQSAGSPSSGKRSETRGWTTTGTGSLSIILFILMAHSVLAGEMLVDLGPESTKEYDVKPYAARIAADGDATKLGISSAGQYAGQTDFDDQMVAITFTPERAGIKMVAFSDDGVTVYIRDVTSGAGGASGGLGGRGTAGGGGAASSSGTASTTGGGTEVLHNKHTGQALPDLGQSLKDIQYTFEPGHSYEITIDYINTLYTGGGDVDGAQLIAYGGGGNEVNEGPQRPDIELTAPKVELISGYQPGGNTDGLAARFKFTVTGANGTYRTIDVNTYALDDDTISNSVSEKMYFDTSQTTSTFLLFRGTDHNHGFSGFLHFVKGIPFEDARTMNENDNPALSDEHKAWRKARVTMHPAGGSLKVTYVYASGNFAAHPWKNEGKSYLGWGSGNLAKSDPTPRDSDYPYGQPLNVDTVQWIQDLFKHNSQKPANWDAAPKSTITFDLNVFIPTNTADATATLIIDIDDVDGVSTQTLNPQITFPPAN